MQLYASAHVIAVPASIGWASLARSISMVLAGSHKAEVELLHCGLWIYLLRGTPTRFLPILVSMSHTWFCAGAQSRFTRVMDYLDTEGVWKKIWSSSWKWCTLCSCMGTIMRWFYTATDWHHTALERLASRLIWGRGFGGQGQLSILDVGCVMSSPGWSLAFMDPGHWPFCSNVFSVRGVVCYGCTVWFWGIWGIMANSVDVSATLVIVFLLRS